MPGCAVDPHTHNHRRHPINPDDFAADLDTFDGHAHDTDDPTDQPVTVADLLDAYYGKDYDFFVNNAASDEANRSFQAIRTAIAYVSVLTQSERAEFDRRTT